MALRWGIASSGKIANDFVTGIKGLPASEHQVVAIAARSLASADKFAKTHNIPKAYEGYEQLAKDADVQVVYVGVLNPQHYEVVLLLLNHGKHVLCEKPFAINHKQAKEMIDLAKKKNLFVMEAIWSRCFPVYREVRKLLDEGVLGEVKYAAVDFGFPIADVDRIKNKDLGGGAILDLGIYILQFQQFVFRGLKPVKVLASGHLNDGGVDDSASAILTYPNGKTAVVTCNATAQMTNEGVIIGTKGTIRIPMFWCPTSYSLNGQVKEFPLIENNGNFNYINSAGLGYEAADVRKTILSGKIESEQVTHEETLQLAAWLDTLRKETGVVFPADS
ncbi:hypothetical protein GWI33_000245 [Rhynchophorus ferrugineus]|uniref:Trans-1,2-dihydrobenzene-1,2-diol dehydrogenase n=1 Tax=Rhynchophorus ferrugineus TaxID=354439 RepID=A0A834IY25_RHYFE|nr:hypothetical protein GWI33_000245 [Rhynchophorus ferrugineus]